MTIWVTGATGFIGRHLVRALADQGHAVHGLGHGALDDAAKERIGLTAWLNGEIDATNLAALAGRTGPPKTIFHLAGGSSVGLSIAQPYEDFSRSVSSTARLLEWVRCSASNCQLIVASSAAIYGAQYKGPISENADSIPSSPYGQHKLIMEQLCRSYALTFGVSIAVARLFSVYGPELRKQLLWDICSRLHRGERNLVLGGTGSEVRDWIDVRDATRLLIKIAEVRPRESYRVINGGSGRGWTVADTAAMLVKNWGGDITVRFSGIARPGDPFSLLADDSKLRRLPFDLQIPFEGGIADYVEWFKEQIY
jgi:UDP-glucose 4-epimerase